MLAGNLAPIPQHTISIGFTYNLQQRALTGNSTRRHYLPSWLDSLTR